jgi:Ala-tRNA(Pro) deacylase
MGMSITLKEYLQGCDVEFEEIEHPYQATSMSTAHSAQVDGEELAKGVLLRDDRGYVMAVLPSSHMIDLFRVRQSFDRDLDFAGEDELEALFEDCDPGAVPPIGGAYGMQVMWDDSLQGHKDIYFEGGDHRTVVHISGADFARLMATADHARFSHHI